MPVFKRPDAEIHSLEIQTDWRGPTHLAESFGKVADVLARHTPRA